MGGPAFVCGKPYIQFDNFYQCKIVHDNREWSSAEQLYQALKFKDQEYQEKIRNQKDTYTVWRMGQNTSYELIDNFEEKKTELMYIANYAKFSQNLELENLLVNTGYEPIKCTGSTEFWNNENSKILERVRQKLRASKPSATIKDLCSYKIMETRETFYFLIFILRRTQHLEFRVKKRNLLKVLGSLICEDRETDEKKFNKRVIEFFIKELAT